MLALSKSLQATEAKLEMITVLLLGLECNLGRDMTQFMSALCVHRCSGRQRSRDLTLPSFSPLTSWLALFYRPKASVPSSITILATQIIYHRHKPTPGAPTSSSPIYNNISDPPILRKDASAQLHLRRRRLRHRYHHNLHICAIRMQDLHTCLH
jgi:hypothetical protein